MILYLKVDVAVWTTEHLYGICILFLSYLLYKERKLAEKADLTLILLILQHYYGREHK